MALEVFDPAMCCSTGVCGSSVDPALASFASDLDWVASSGVTVRRYNLGQEPGVFAEREQVRTLLNDGGEAALPIVIAGGAVRSSGRYPSRNDLAEWAGLESAATPTSVTSVSTDVVAELAAVGAAIGSNCEPCFKFHYDKARKLGLSNEQLAVAVRTAQAVKDTPATKMLDLASKLLSVEVSGLRPGAASTAEPAAGQPTAAPTDDAGCCGGGAAPEGAAELMQISAASGSSNSCC